MLLGIGLRVTMADAGSTVTRKDGRPLATATRYGFVWACLGDPAQAIIAIPEAAEDERVITTCGSIGTHVSGPRMIENFLDVGHLGYVHEGFLASEPHTAVQPYEVVPRPGGGIIVRGAKIYQPMASISAREGYVVDCGWEVARPLTTCLYKASSLHRDRFDVIYLFAQPVDEDDAVAHVLALFVADGTTKIDVYPGREHEDELFLAINPLGTVPVLESDGDLLTDWQAMLVYLVRRGAADDSWLAADEVGRMEWLGFARRLGDSAGLARHHDCMSVDADIARCRADAHRLLRELDRHLWFAEQQQQAWLMAADRPSIADIAVFVHVILCEESGIERMDYPAVRRWTDRVRRIAGFVPMSGVFPLPPIRRTDAGRAWPCAATMAETAVGSGG